jgi:excisionase family DNA binding protein
MTITNDVHEPILITVPEAARRLAIGRTLTYELIAANELPAVRIGRAIRVPADAIDSFVARQLSMPTHDTGVAE